MKIFQRHSGAVLFESAAPDMRTTLTEAIAASCDLRGCNLSGCDLSGCDLRGCNLSGCDLSGCDLSGCDLRGCDLSGCDLRGCDLPEGFCIARLDFGGWSITVTPTETTIGCQQHPNALWLTADPRWISVLDRKASAWWARHGASVQAVIRDVMAQE